MSIDPAHGDAGDEVIPSWSLADRMRKIRRDVLHVEQAEMAHQLGVTRQAYAAWETGRSAPRDVVSVAKRLELISGVPAAWTLEVNAPRPFRPAAPQTTVAATSPSRGAVRSEGVIPASRTETRHRHLHIVPSEHGSADVDEVDAA